MNCQATELSHQIMKSYEKRNNTEPNLRVQLGVASIHRGPFGNTSNFAIKVSPKNI